MKLSLNPKVVLITNPNFCNPYPNPLNGIPVAMKKIGIEFLLINPEDVDFKEFKRQIEKFNPELIFGLIQLKHEIKKIGEYLNNYKHVPAINWNLEDPNSVVSPQDDINMADLTVDYDLWFGIDKKMLPFWKTKAFFLPQAFDDNYFFWQDIEKVYDVSYIGQLGHGNIFQMYWPYMKELSIYGKKAMLCIDRPMGIPIMPRPIEKFLRSKKRRYFLQKLPIWKCGWKNPKDEQEKAVIINQSKVHFGLSRLHGDWEEKFLKTFPKYPIDKHGQLYQIKSRLFQAVGSGTLAINDYIPELEEMFEIGKEIITFEYGNFDEMREKLGWYIKNDNEREKIANAGFQRAHRDHTFTARINQIFEIVRNSL